MSDQVGIITWISGPVVRARGSRHIGMLELVEVGDETSGGRSDRSGWGHYHGSGL